MGELVNLAVARKKKVDAQALVVQPTVVQWTQRDEVLSTIFWCGVFVGFVVCAVVGFVVIVVAGYRFVESLFS